MINRLKSSLPLAITGVVFASLAPLLHAQDTASQEQQTALQIVTQMTDSQNAYYQKTGKFHTGVNDIAKDLKLTLPSSYNYGIRTSPDAAYIYVMPAKTPMAEQLKAYVGVALVTPEEKAPLITLVCENTKPGRIRPADPKIVKSKESDKAGMQLECGASSVPVSSAQK